MAKRRAHSEGSVYQRKSDGRWVASVDGGYVNGKRVRFTAYAATEREALEKRDDLKKHAKRARPSTAGVKTVGDFLDHWMTSSVRKDRAPKTIESYQGVIDKHILPELGRKHLRKVDRADVQTMLDRVAEKGGIGPRSVQNVQAVIRSALNDAIKWDMIDSNPANHTSIARVPKTHRTGLTFEQGKTLLAEVDDDRFQALYVLAAVCGMRRGECLGLRWSDVDYEKREIRIRQQVIVIGNRPTITRLKTDGSSRTMPMLSMVESALRRRYALLEEERAFAGSAWQEHDLVFPSRVGTPYQPTNLHKQYKAHLRRAGLPDVSFHSLRHTAASFLVALNVHPRIAMSLLGHTNIRTTMEIYSHAQQDDLREALELVEAQLQRVTDAP